MLVLDLDGTTLTSTGELEERDVRAAAALHGRGVAITINTGRLYTGTDWVARALGINGSVGVMNGSELVDVQTGQARHGRYLTRGQLAYARGMFQSTEVTTFVFGSRTIHYGERDRRYAGYLGVWTRQLASHPDVCAAPSWEDDEVVAVCAVGEAAAIARARDTLAEARPGLGTWVFTTREGESFLKVRRAGDDKGTALSMLAAERGLSADQCVAVGDWTNDLPMLEAAGRSFVMGHAGDEVRARADVVLDAVDGGAIAEVAERVWGITPRRG